MDMANREGQPDGGDSSFWITIPLHFTSRYFKFGLSVVRLNRLGIFELHTLIDG